MIFKTTNAIILRTTRLDKFYKHTAQKIEVEISKFELKGHLNQQIISN